jgi:hypothetical protein
MEIDGVMVAQHYKYISYYCIVLLKCLKQTGYDGPHL